MNRELSNGRSVLPPPSREATTGPQGDARFLGRTHNCVARRRINPRRLHRYGGHDCCRLLPGDRLDEARSTCVPETSGVPATSFRGPLRRSRLPGRCRAIAAPPRRPAESRAAPMALVVGRDVSGPTVAPGHSLDYLGQRGGPARVGARVDSTSLSGSVLVAHGQRHRTSRSVREHGARSAS